jgi:Ca2+-binding EF-hand superfamily protein
MLMASFRISACSAVVLCSLTLALPLLAAESKSGTASAQFIKMDANKDGKISADEHATGAKKMFDTMDRNKDGKVTAAEMDAAHRRITGTKTTKSDMTAAEKIKVIDTNLDGVLTAEEHAAGSRAMFEKMDTDQDGFLTKNELAAGHARMLKKPAR